MPALLAVVVLVAGVLLAGGGGGLLTGGTGSPTPVGATSGPGGSVVPDPTPAPTPTPRPGLGGTELYGYLPYWQLSDAVATYLKDVPLTTLALFSVSARRSGAINTRDIGYQRVTGELGRRVIAAAQRRGARVELAFTSFGEQRNATFFGRVPAPAANPAPSTGPTPSLPAPSSAPPSSPSPPPPWQRTVTDLVALADDLGVDGINVDVERMDELDRDAYGEFLVALRSALVSAHPNARVTVATEAGLRGTGNARTAAASGVDRVFLMGYDYHWSGSQPGASSPVDRSDGLPTLRWSIAQYVEAGVPRGRILLGLPLYGMTWRTVEPDRAAPVLGSGTTWIPSRHLDILLNPAFQPTRDPLEVAEYFTRPEGEAWRLTYYDSPDTLRAKLALARDEGLAGGGFWAIGYERGLPGYVDLMRDFIDGDVDRSEAPPGPS